MARRKRRTKRSNWRIYLLIVFIIILVGLAAPYIADFFHSASRWNKDYYYPHDREREDHLIHQEEEPR